MRIGRPAAATRISIFIPQDPTAKKGTMMTSAIGERGYTLVEMGLVMAMMGLVASLCWPSVRAYAHSLKTRAEVSEHVSTLRAARERAILFGDTERTPQTSFFPDGSAEFFQGFYPEIGRPIFELRVDEAGRITVHEI